MPKNILDIIALVAAVSGTVAAVVGFVNKALHNKTLAEVQKIAGSVNSVAVAAEGAAPAPVPAPAAPASDATPPAPAS